jgi:hypothetical protein
LWYWGLHPEPCSYLATAAQWTHPRAVIFIFRTCAVILEDYMQIVAKIHAFAYMCWKFMWFDCCMMSKHTVTYFYLFNGIWAVFIFHIYK